MAFLWFEGFKGHFMTYTGIYILDLYILTHNFCICKLDDCYFLLWNWPLRHGMLKSSAWIFPERFSISQTNPETAVICFYWNPPKISPLKTDEFSRSLRVKWTRILQRIPYILLLSATYQKCNTSQRQMYFQTRYINWCPWLHTMRRKREYVLTVPF